MSAPEVEVRPVESDADLELSVAIYNTVSPARAVSLTDVRSYREAVPEQQGFLAWLGGEAIGEGLAALEPQHRHQDVARASVSVLPARRRRGVGSALYRAVSAWAAERGKNALEVWVQDDDPDGLAYAAPRGFVEVARDARLALDLASIEEPAVEPPPGIEIVTWAEQPELAPGMYEVALEAYPDVPGEEESAMESFEDWLAHDLGGSGDRPEATFVALAGDEVVGYAKFHLSDARPRVATHDLTGVKRAWRGHGIASALKAAEIAWAKRAGYERLETANELRNAPIRHLNERFGYRAIPGRRLLRGPLATAADGS